MMKRKRKKKQLWRISRAHAWDRSLVAGRRSDRDSALTANAPSLVKDSFDPRTPHLFKYGQTAM